MSSTLVLAQAITGLAALVALGAAGVAHAAEPAGSRRDLERLSQRRIFFGHQSVGRDLLAGLRDLAAQEQVALRIADAAPGGVPAATLAHAPVAENGDPARKLRSFEAAFSDGLAAGADLALVKFCFVDFSPSTDVAALFSGYQRTLERLRAAHPRTTFVHVTAPLTTVQGGLKGFVKGLLGRAPGGQLENERREAYNALLREAYQGREPLFDLAAVESTWPDGRREIREWEGRRAPALVEAFTEDGGHLNQEGRLRAARALAATLAAAP